MPLHALQAGIKVSFQLDSPGLFMYTLVSIASPNLDTAQVGAGTQVANGRVPVFQVTPCSLHADLDQPVCKCSRLLLELAHHQPTSSQARQRHHLQTPERTAS